MSLASWPGDVPYVPQRDSIRRSNARLPIVSEMEDGPPITRNQANTRVKKMQYVIPMTDDERASFETFVESTLHFGVDHFNMSVPLIRADTFVTRRCYIENADWSDSHTGSHWLISFTLCVFVTP